MGLIELDELKSFLKISAGDSRRDAQLEDLIDSCSVQVEGLLLGGDGFGLGPEERIDTYRTEKLGYGQGIFLPPFPGPLYPFWDTRAGLSPEALPQLDLSTLQFVVDQVLRWVDRFQNDARYAKGLEDDLKGWLKESQRSAASAGANRRFAYIRTLVIQASEYQLSSNWDFHLRWCSYWPAGVGRLEAILTNHPDEKIPRVRLDVLFPAEPIHGPLAAIPTAVRRELRPFAIPTVYIGEGRSRDDILAELLIVGAAHIGPDAIRSFGGEVFSWFKRYTRRFKPKSINLQGDELDSILFDVLAHLAQHYGPTGSGKIFPRYLKRVLYGFVMQYLKARGAENTSAANLPQKIGRKHCIPQGVQGDSSFVPGFSTVGGIQAADSPLTVLQAQEVLGIPRDFIYDAIRKGTVTANRKPGESMRLDRDAINRLKLLKAESAKRKFDAYNLAAARGIQRKSAMRTLQRRRRRTFLMPQKS